MLMIKLKPSQIEEEYKTLKVVHYKTGVEKAWIEYDRDSGALRLCFYLYDGDKTETICLGDRINVSENIEVFKLYREDLGEWREDGAHVEINGNGYIRVRFGQIERIFEAKHICRRKSIDLIGMRYDVVMATDGTIYLIDCIDFSEFLKFDDPLKFGEFVYNYCVDKCAERLKRRCVV
jgi:hypothetical protein